MAKATDGVGILLLGRIRVTGTASRHPETEGAPTCCVRVVTFVTGTADVKVQRTQASLVGKWRDRAAALSLAREADASPLIGRHGGFRDGHDSDEVEWADGGSALLCCCQKS